MSTIAERVRAQREAPKPKKRKRAPLPLAIIPHTCSVLAVDPAKLSGWSMTCTARLYTYGECAAIGPEPARIIERFLAETPGPHVIVVERPFRVRFGNQMAIGTGDATWRGYAEAAGFGRRKGRHLVRVYPGTWRSKFLSKGDPNRDEIRKREHADARIVVIRDCGPRITERAPRIGKESAPAILMGQWGSYAGEVGAALAKRNTQKGRVA